MSSSNIGMAQIMHLLQLSDSALPVGMFSFSAGLESAIAEGVVCDITTLNSYVRDMVERTLTSDCIVALAARRASLRDDWDSLRRIDQAANLNRLSEEQRRMSQRMGRKLTELAAEITDLHRVVAWAEASRRGDVVPSLAATQGVIASAIGIGERFLTTSLLYGATSMILSAALRLMRISHIETQRILFAIGSDTEHLFERIASADIEDICAFSPQADLLASLHEKGNNRMFMS